MTEKRFTCHQMIANYSTGEDLDFDFLQELIDEQEQPKDLRMHISDGNKVITYRECVDLLNELNDENEQLKKENKELRQDNDIKFWKMQCLQSLNNNQMMLFELSRVIQQGYEVSDEFKQYLNEVKEHDKKIREKHKRLF